MSLNRASLNLKSRNLGFKKQLTSVGPFCQNGFRLVELWAWGSVSDASVTDNQKINFAFFEKYPVQYPGHELLTTHSQIFLRFSSRNF